MTLTDLVQVGVALGASGTGLGSVLAAGAYALRKRSDAHVARANADRVAAETEAAAQQTVAAMLATMRADVEDAKADAKKAREDVEQCNKRHDSERDDRLRGERECHQREVRSEQRMATLRGEVSQLRALMRERGIPTPQPFAAVSADVKEAP